MQRAFSLVELSIVLVILGLLTGGILAGKSLIRASELRAVTTEYSRYFTAIKAFRDKYFQYPGDSQNATRFWGYQVNGNGCTTNSGAAVVATGVCDGDGSGVLGQAGASNAGELFQTWRHLAAAGLVEGTYSGLAHASHTHGATRGVNTPASKLNQGLWMIWNVNYNGSSSMFQNDFGNSLSISGENSASWPTMGIMKPEEAWNIDTKMDDGLAARGKVWAIRWDDCTPAASATDFTQTYDLTNTANDCGLIFGRQF